jgi:archaemetzincin
MKYIYLLPIGNIDKELLEYIGRKIQDYFRIPYRILNFIDIPEHAKDRKRNQYDAEVILREIGLLDFPSAERVLGIINVDLYSKSLSFIFGEAESPGRNAVISTTRLNPEFYDQKFNKDVFYERILKEVVHELGHTFSLGHCPKKTCVMYFSNTLTDTDFKSEKFCERCEKLYQLASS